MKKAKYKLRQQQLEDFDFLYNLNKATMMSHVIKTWGNWDEEFQIKYFKEKFEKGLSQVILVENERVGTLVILEDEDRITIDLMLLLPEFQGRGIGSEILDNLINEAKNKNKSLMLTVLKSNNQARRLYERKGFKITDENNERYFMTYEE